MFSFSAHAENILDFCLNTFFTFGIILNIAHLKFDAFKSYLLKFNLTAVVRPYAFRVRTYGFFVPISLRRTALIWHNFSKRISARGHTGHVILCKNE